MNGSPQELTEAGEVVADGEEELVKVANMAKSVSGKSGGGSASDGKPKKDRRTTMLGRFRRPKAAAAAQEGGGAGGEGVVENAKVLNYISSKKVQDTDALCFSSLALSQKTPFLLSRYTWCFFLALKKVSGRYSARHIRCWRTDSPARGKRSDSAYATRRILVCFASTSDHPPRREACACVCLQPS